MAIDDWFDWELIGLWLKTSSFERYNSTTGIALLLEHGGASKIIRVFVPRVSKILLRCATDNCILTIPTIGFCSLFSLTIWSQEVDPNTPAVQHHHLKKDTICNLSNHRASAEAKIQHQPRYFSTMHKPMPNRIETSYDVSLLGDKVGRETSWSDDRRFTTPTEWIPVVFSFVVTSLSSLLISMSIAFSPLTVSTYETTQDHDWNSNSAHSPPTHLPSINPCGSVSPLENCGTTSNVGHRTSKEKDNVAVECVHDKVSTTKNFHYEQELFSSPVTARNFSFAATASKRITAPVILAPQMLFEGGAATVQLHRTLTRNRDYEEGESPPNKKLRFGSPSITTAFDTRDQKRNRSSFTNTDSEINDTQKKKRRRILERRRQKEQRWETMFRQLMKYQQTHGNTDAPYNTQLGRWVSNQRAFRKTKTLSNHRVEMLDSILFDWKFSEKKQWL